MSGNDGFGMLLRVVYTRRVCLLVWYMYVYGYNTDGRVCVNSRQWSENDTPSLIDNRAALWGFYTNSYTRGRTHTHDVYIFKDTKRLNGCWKAGLNKHVYVYIYIVLVRRSCRAYRPSRSSVRDKSPAHENHRRTLCCPPVPGVAPDERQTTTTTTSSRARAREIPNLSDWSGRVEGAVDKINREGPYNYNSVYLPTANRRLVTHDRSYYRIVCNWAIDFWIAGQRNI